jgi:hypothetical protein
MCRVGRGRIAEEFSKSVYHGGHEGKRLWFVEVPRISRELEN